MNRDCSNYSTPSMSAPSSPQRPLNLFFCSTPTSPRSSSSFFHGGDDDGNPSPLAGAGEGDDGGGFEFDFGGQLDMMIRPSLSSADELFDGGIIRPMKPLPAITSAGECSESRKFEIGKQSTTKLGSEIDRKFDSDDQNRGRSSKNLQMSRSNSRRKGLSRSLSPLRVSEFALLNHPEPPPNPTRSSNNGGPSSSARGGSRKWRLKDLLLFRSASEGRATTKGKDPLKKYFSISMAAKKLDEHDSKNWGSFRSTASSMADVGSVSRRVSAHERHYTANRALADEMKKKTSLPYKHGLLGCLGLGFNPAFQDFSKTIRSFGS